MYEMSEQKNETYQGYRRTQPLMKAKEEMDGKKYQILLHHTMQKRKQQQRKHSPWTHYVN